MSIIQPMKAESLTIGQAIALTAAHCSKTLIAASSLGSPVLLECTRQVFPGLVDFIAKTAPLLNDGSISEARTAAVGEVWKAFSAFFSSIPESQRTLAAVLFDPSLAFIIGTRALCILLPTMSLLFPNQPLKEAASKLGTGSITPCVRTHGWTLPIRET